MGWPHIWVGYFLPAEIIMAKTCSTSFTSTAWQILNNNAAKIYYIHCEWLPNVYFDQLRSVRYKQRGKEAVLANNVFFYTSYEGTADTDKISDPVSLFISFDVAH